MSDDAEREREREGEEEVQLVRPQVPSAAGTPQPEEVKADENLGPLGIVTEIPEKEAWWDKGGDEEEEKKEEEPEEETEEPEEDDPEETEEERANRKARKKYLKHVGEFYQERLAFFRMQRNTTPAGKQAFKDSFHKGKNDSKLAFFEKNGTMTLMGKDGTLIRKVVPFSYREPTSEEHEILDKWRKKQIIKTEKAFEDAKQILREAQGSDKNVKRAQRLALEADLALQEARFATKGVAYYKKAVMNQLLFENPSDVHKTEAFAFVSTPMTSQQRYAVQEEPGEEKEESSEDKPESDVILFQFAEGPYDFLSSWYMQKFKYKGIRYRCAYQAILAELARKFGDDEKAEEIMEATNPEDMELTWDDLDEATEREWRQRLKKLILKVNRAKFAKEDLAERLIATGDKHLGCIPPENELDDYQGIGRGFSDPKAWRREKWKKGGNFYGKIVEQIRNELIVAKNPSMKRPVKKAKEEKKEKKAEEVEEEDDEGEDREEDAGEEAEEEEKEAPTAASKAKRAIYQAKRKVYLEEYAQAIKDKDKAGAKRILAEAAAAGIDIASVAAAPAKSGARTSAAAKLDQTEAYLAGLKDV